MSNEEFTDVSPEDTAPDETLEAPLEENPSEVDDASDYANEGDPGALDEDPEDGRDGSPVGDSSDDPRSLDAEDPTRSPEALADEAEYQETSANEEQEELDESGEGDLSPEDFDEEGFDEHNFDNTIAETPEESERNYGEEEGAPGDFGTEEPESVEGPADDEAAQDADFGEFGDDSEEG